MKAKVNSTASTNRADERSQYQTALALVRSIVLAFFALAGGALPTHAGTSQAYSWYTTPSGCMRNADPTYNANVDELARRALGRADTSVGCVTLPWLADNYFRFGTGATHHAGIDFTVGPSAFQQVSAIWGGDVVEQALDTKVSPPRSTLVIESVIAGNTYRVFYLHCSEHYVSKGQKNIPQNWPICRAGSVGADKAHLHIEVKRGGTVDFADLRALSGSHCGGTCNENHVIAMTVDPVDLIAFEKSASASPAKQADDQIAKCLNTFQAYFGSRRGEAYTDGPFRIQLTTGGWAGAVIAAAIEETADPKVVWYYWYGWNNVPITWC